MPESRFLMSPLFSSVNLQMTAIAMQGEERGSSPFCSVINESKDQPEGLLGATHL